MLKTKMTAGLTAVLGGALAVCFYAGGAAPASAATTAADLTACPTSPLPPGGPLPGGGGIAYAKTVAPANNSASILIKHLLPSGVTDGFVRISGSEGGLLPKVTALKDGSFIVAWTNSVGTESDGSPNEDLFLRHFGGSESPPVR